MIHPMKRVSHLVFNETSFKDRKQICLNWFQIFRDIRIFLFQFFCSCFRLNTVVILFHFCLSKLCPFLLPKKIVPLIRSLLSIYFLDYFFNFRFSKTTVLLFFSLVSRPAPFNIFAYIMSECKMYLIISPHARQ